MLTKLCGIVGVVLCLTLGLMVGNVFAETVPSVAEKPSQIFAFNDLGMHCYDSDYSVFTILPPFNNLHAQVLRRGPVPRILDNTSVRVFYSARKDASGSINTTSGKVNGVPKTNFWDHVLALFGLSLEVNYGIPVPPPDGPSARMPGRTNRPRPFVHGYDPGMKWFSALGIPMTQVDDQLKDNPYPLMKVEARSAGYPVTALPVVVPVSNEMSCGNCHATGNLAANDDVGLKYGILGWSSSQDPVIQYKENILILHDAANLTTLMSSQPVLCAVCHYSPALDLTGSGPPPGGLPYMSHALHGHHGQLVDGTGIPIFPRDRGTATNPCYECHPGKNTQCFRGVMAQAGLVCIDCHGNMLAVGGVGRLPMGGSASLPVLSHGRCAE